MKTSFVRKEADFSLLGAPWGLPNTFPVSEKVSSLCPPRSPPPLPLALASRADTKSWGGVPGQGWGSGGTIWMFFPRIDAISALCGCCPRGLMCLGRECAGEGVSSQSCQSWHRGRIGSLGLTPCLAQPHNVNRLRLDGCKWWDVSAGPAQLSPAPSVRQVTPRQGARSGQQQHLCSRDQAPQARGFRRFP